MSIEPPRTKMIKVLKDLNDTSVQTGYRHLGPSGPRKGASGHPTNLDRRMWRNNRKNGNAPEKTPLQVREDLHVYRNAEPINSKVRKDLN